MSTSKLYLQPDLGPARAGDRPVKVALVGAQRLPRATGEDGTVDEPKGVRTECRGWRR